MGGASPFQNSHVHDVCFVQRLVFDLWVDDGWVGDPCGMWTWGAGHHVVREPVMTADGLITEDNRDEAGREHFLKCHKA